ncbi:MAG: RebB family R body protein [Rhodobacter sp.]|nr:RebB family R body protein [Rhodobacter sp.]
MANETVVNPQITDAVTQTNVKVVAESPAQAMATLYQVAAQAAGIAINNANTAQTSLSALNPAIVSKAIATINGG